MDLDIYNDHTTLEKILVSEASYKQVPISVTLELLPLCNMNCDMCYIRLSHKEMESKGRLLEINQWIEIAKQLKDNGVLFVLITGGEPLLYPHFKELYITLKQMGMIITLNTNGTLIDETWAKFFTEYPPRRINITLYGTNDSTYENLCHYPNGYTKVMQALNLLKEKNLPVKLNASAVKKNIKELDDIYTISNHLEMPLHTDTYMIPNLLNHSLSVQVQARLSPEDAAIAELAILQKEMSKESFQEYIVQVIESLQQETEHPQTITCMAGNCSFAIDWHGNMHPCLTLSETSISVLEHNIQECWSIISKKSKELEMNKKCTTCNLRPICKTCVASAYLETGSYNGIPDYLCRFSKKIAELIHEKYNEMNSSL